MLGKIHSMIFKNSLSERREAGAAETLKIEARVELESPRLRCVPLWISYESSYVLTTYISILSHICISIPLPSHHFHDVSSPSTFTPFISRCISFFSNASKLDYTKLLPQLVYGSTIIWRHLHITTPTQVCGVAQFSSTCVPP